MEQVEHCAECGEGYKRVFVLRVWKIRFIIEVHEDDERLEETQVVSKTEVLR